MIADPIPRWPMILDVTPAGLFIPRAMLGDVQTVEVILDGSRLLVIPVASRVAPETERVSIYDLDHGLGADPIDLDVTDASVHHDEYIYGDPHGLNR
jgi:hypothetical protein